MNEMPWNPAPRPPSGPANGSHRHPPPGPFAPPPGSAMAASPPPGSRTVRPGRVKMTAAVTAVAVGATIGALWAGLGPAPADPVSEVRLEATSFAGPNPFMTPVGEDRSDVAVPADATGTFSGDTPGLFGETADKPSCTRQALIDNLAADTTKSTAWGRALGVEPADISTYGNSLNPVVLRSDTAVTEHGYADGTYTAYPAVLQAGTAVLVNSFGEPTVKCFSGNPLTRPADFAQAGYVGAAWRSFTPTRITYVRPTKIVVRQYIYVDIDRGDPRPHRSWCWDHPTSKYCERPNPDRWCEKHPDSKYCSGREDEHDGDNHDDGKPGDGKPGDEKPGDGKPGDENPGDGKPGDGKPGDEKPGDGNPPVEGNPPAEGNPPVEGNPPLTPGGPGPDGNTLPGGGTKKPDGSVITPPFQPCPGGPGCLVAEKRTTPVSTGSPDKAKSPKRDSGPAGGGADGEPADGAGKGGKAAGGGGSADDQGSAGESVRGGDKAGDGE